MPAKRTKIDEDATSDESDSDDSEVEYETRRVKYSNWTDFFLFVDMFGATPSLEMKGKRKVKSCCGAFVSLVVMFLMLVFVAY